MTAFLQGSLEGLIDAYGCNIILLHHSNKTSGDLIEDPKELARALTRRYDARGLRYCLVHPLGMLDGMCQGGPRPEAYR